MAISETILLAHSNAPDTEASARGIPNYLGGLAIAPDGLSGWVPSKQDNIARGTLRDGNPLTHESTVRAIASFLDMTSGNGSELLANRLDYNNAGVVSQAAFGKYGNYVFMSLETNREVVMVDAYARTIIGRINVGLAPQGLTVSDDGLTLYVHNFTERSVSIVDISKLITGKASSVNGVTTVDVVSNEALASDVLLGKQLFYDAADSRLASESYVSCASCHNEGDDDGRVWDFTGFGEGLRNTISLVGRGGAEHGPLHWTANFDEFHDFEGQIRSFAGGTGLMDTADFNNTSDPLGLPKAGLSSDLDALAAYLQSLGSFGDSPHRESDGSLTTSAENGKLIFETENCVACHSGQGFTDSSSLQRHDVGTIQPHSGQRIGGTLDGFDTPTLRGLWATAPYLHDGSAATVADAISAHANVNLSASDLADLEAYLLQIDDNEAAPNGNATCATPGLLHEWWDNIPGGAVIDLTADADFPNNPTGSGTLTIFEIPANVDDDYGVRVRGYIIPPETGNYTFWIASDDSGQLWLSTDDSAANAQLIAEVDGWTFDREYDKFASQQSAEINLVAGQRYYVEALMKEYGGGDNLSVAWQTPSASQTEISGDALCMFESLGDAPTADVTVDNASGSAPLTVNFDGAGSADTDGTIVSYDWTFGDGATATGSTAAHTYDSPGIYYAELTVTDNDGFTDTFDQTITVSGEPGTCDNPGSLLYEEWINVPGTAIDDLTSLAAYPYHPDGSSQITDFVIPTNTNDRYGVRVRGYVVAPVSGEYTFWIASDDAGLLLLSPSADPAAATEIARVWSWTNPEEWDRETNQESDPITLLAGQVYYIEALMKEGAGGDNLAVAWQIPSGQQQIIPSPNLCSYGIDNVPPTALLTASVTSGEAPLTVSFDGTGSSDYEGPLASYLWSFDDGATATTATASHTFNAPGVYDVTLTVTDADGLTATATKTVVATDSSGAVECTTPGIVNRELWAQIWSGGVGELLADARYPDNPSSVETQTNFVAPSNVGDAYAVRMRAYLVAPETGSYTFYLASDNEGQLWLGTGSHPATAVQVAQNWWSPEQDWSSAAQSASITLVAGETYYIEGFHAASWSSDYYAVAWTTPSNGTPTVIPSDVFCAYEDVGGRSADSTSLRQAEMNRGQTYTYVDLTNSPIFQTLPAEHATEIALIFLANGELRDRAYAMRETVLDMLNNDATVSGEIVFEVTELYNDLHAVASPGLQDWLSTLWNRLPIADYSLVGERTPEAMASINDAANSNAVPTAISLGMIGELWDVAPMMLMMIVMFSSLTVVVVWRRR